MKNIFIIISTFLLFSLDTSAQQKSLPDTGLVRAHDRYDNFKDNPAQGNSFVVLKNPRTGAVLFEDTLKNGQCSSCYDELTLKADSFYLKKEYTEASVLYTAAFRLNNDKGKVKHRLSAACSYVQLQDFNKAFEELNRVVFIAKFHNIHHLTSEKCFEALKSDKRWEKLIAGVEENIKSIQKQLNAETKIEQQ
jgi:tetratricopeptide (TPR) repeat protein